MKIISSSKKLIVLGQPIPLAKLTPGALFVYENTIALKTEYFTEGAIYAYIVGTGERFWGGVQTAVDLNALMVQPLVVENEKVVNLLQ